MIDQPQSNQRLIIYSVLALGLACIVGGAALTYKGYEAQLLIGGGTSAIAGLLGVLSNRSATPPQDLTISGQPPVVSLTSSQTKIGPVDQTNPNPNILV
jgi:hypothetical protein